MQFLNPEYLWIGAAACAAAIALTVWAARRRRRDLENAVAAPLRAELLAGCGPLRRGLKAGLVILALADLFVALARPIAGYTEEVVHSGGIDVMVAMDTSKSMAATDVMPDRLERAKLALLQFLDGLGGDRAGLIPFAGDAFVTCPLTLDRDAFRESLRALDTDTMPLGGTDIAAAIDEATTAFASSEADQKVLLLVTDGEALEGDALARADVAARAGIVIHTVGVGTPAGELLRSSDGGFVEDDSGKPVRSALDEAGLRAIAAAAGGRYEPLGRRAEGLLAVRDEVLRKLPKSDFEARVRRTPMDLFTWPLGIALLLLGLEFVLRDGRRRRQVAVAPRVLAAAGLALFATNLGLPAQGVPDSAHDPRVAYNEAREKYEQGRFGEARSAFEQSLQSTDPGVHALAYYGLGNTGYRAGQALREQNPKAAVEQWQRAIEAYDRALGLNGKDADARFNRDFVSKKLEELQRQLEEEEQQQQEQQQNQQQQGQQRQRREEHQGQQQEQQQSQQGQQGQQGQRSQQRQRSQQDQQQQSQQQQQPDGRQDHEDGQQDGASRQGRHDPASRQQAGAGTDAQPQPQDNEEAGHEEQLRNMRGQEQPDPQQAQPGTEKKDEQRDEGEKSTSPGAARALMSARQAGQLLDALEEHEGRLRFMPARVRESRSNRQNRKDW